MQPPRVVISAGDGGSLDQAIACARLIAPLDHISVVATAHTAPTVCRALARYGGVELVVQLREQRGADVLLPLAHAFGVDPLASIVFMPAEISIRDSLELAFAIKRALARPDTISVIGWTSAEFVAVGRITQFWDVLRDKRPTDAAVLECYLEAMETEDEGRILFAAYEHLEGVSFDSILADAPSLEIVTVAWTDGRRRVTIPPETAPGPRSASGSVLSGLARVTGPMTDAPTIVAHTQRPVDSRAPGYRNGN